MARTVDTAMFNDNASAVFRRWSTELWHAAAIIFLILPFMITLLSLTPFHAEAKAGILIGAVEDVVLLPWGVKLPARVDTGASMTSLGVRGLTVEKNVAHFRLPEEYGNTLIRLPVLRYSEVRSPHHRQRRPVVRIELCVGSKRFRVDANLTNRDHLEYPLLLGRNVLSQGFLIDCGQEKMLPTKCMEGVSQ